jgi:hypothetical protein
MKVEKGNDNAEVYFFIPRVRDHFLSQFPLSLIFHPHHIHHTKEGLYASLSSKYDDSSFNAFLLSASTEIRSKLKWAFSI